MARKNMTSDQLRAALLKAGVELLEELGIAGGLERIMLKDVIERSGVSRSSAYLLLGANGSPIEQFRIELLEHLDRPRSTAGVMEEALSVLDEHADVVASGDPAGLAMVLREVIRRAAAASAAGLDSQLEWRLYVASLAAVGTGPTDTRAVDVHQRISEQHSLTYLEDFTTVMAVFGIRPRAPMTLRQFTATVAATIEGVVLRMRFDPLLRSIERATGPNDSTQLWDAAAVAFEGLVLAFAEPDPTASASADLSTWMRSTPS